MSYQVLARKWRPRTFHELVGQEHVSRALVNALDQGRLHHAYLFTGTRGVGKTTLARILAKCLNCEQGVGSQPCGQCETCRDIDSGRFVDLIEVDAASRTKVEDTRELLDNVQYAPTQGRYKVYLIDEVHMLSTHSFNALLKTLEEPPPHVKFLLATTDPQKLPVTVLSRCLQFTLKNMPPERVAEHLTRVLEAEQVAFDPQALWLLGKAADGSMRDAMSLTDQAIAFGQGEVRREDVAAMLGTLDHAHLIALAEALADVDAERLLTEVASLAEQGPDFAGVLDELSGLMHRLAIAQMVPGALDNGHGDRDELLALAGRFTAEDVQLYYQIALQGRGDIDNAPDTRAAVEMTLLRMLAFRPQGVPTPPQTDLPLRRGAQQGGRSPSDERQTSATSTAEAPQATSTVPAPKIAPEPAAAAPSAPVERQAPSAEPADPPLSSPAEPPASSDFEEDRPPWSTETEASQAKAPATGIVPEAASPEPSAEQGAEQGETVTVAAESGSAAIDDASDFEDASRFDDQAGFSDEAYAWAAEAAEASAPEPGDSPAVDVATDIAAASAPVEQIAQPARPDFQSSGIQSDGAQGDVAPADTGHASAGADGSTAAIEADAVPAMAEAPMAEMNSPAATQDSPVNAGQLTHGLWLDRFDQLDIGGLTRNLAAHCVIESDDGSALKVTLDPGQSAMLSDLHIERITKALAGLGYTRRLEISVAELDGARETAKAKRDREARERHARAVEALRVDPHIQELEARFGARLMEGSVTADRV
ncbi:DNA polymerase III subunit gamma/tau [Salinicola salarius]|uniref:DNA polymerase III subunit gamma/tau n=1 Tax=Salinicola salarius TaxID=430457 RepID=UPI000B405C99|nr:DNA polymerase III subunit gamma/tau [Salinicola salarius]